MLVQRRDKLCNFEEYFGGDFVDDAGLWERRVARMILQGWFLFVALRVQWLPLGVSFGRSEVRNARTHIKNRRATSSMKSVVE